MDVSVDVLRSLFGSVSTMSGSGLVTILAIPEDLPAGNRAPMSISPKGEASGNRRNTGAPAPPTGPVTWNRAVEPFRPPSGYGAETSGKSPTRSRYRPPL